MNLGSGDVHEARTAIRGFTSPGADAPMWLKSGQAPDEEVRDLHGALGFRSVKNVTP
jgi:hypothetical protein